MIAELGHYALMLALGLALIQGSIPIFGTRSGDVVLASMASPIALAQFAFVAVAFGALAVCYVTSDFSVLNVYENSQLDDAVGLQAHQHLGEPRRLDDAVGAHSRPVRRAGRGLRRQSADGAQGQRARGAGVDRRRLSALHSHHLESVRCVSPTRRSRAAISIRSSRIRASPSIRRSSISAMSASRSPSPSRSPP